MLVLTSVAVTATPGIARETREVAGATSLFIHGRYDFAVVDRLLTNFHVPRSSLLGAKSLDKVAARVALEVGRVLPPGHPANDFDLSPNPRAPVNVFVPLEYLQARVEKPGRVIEKAAQ